MRKFGIIPATILILSNTLDTDIFNVVAISVLLFLIVYMYANASLFIIGYKKLTQNSYIYYSTLAAIALIFCFI